jgi:site-specific DNA-cytosine methylase
MEPHRAALVMQVRAFLLNSANYGVPQSRRRIIVAAAKHNRCLPQPPSVTHIDDAHFPPTLSLANRFYSPPVPEALVSCVPVSDVIGDLPDPIELDLVDKHRGKKLNSTDNANLKPCVCCLLLHIATVPDPVIISLIYVYNAGTPFLGVNARPL